MTAPTPTTFTATDLRAAAALCRATLGPVADRDWSVPAHGLTWDCRATLDHVCDCLAFYAHDLGARVQTIEGAARDGYATADSAELIRTVETLSEVLALVAEGTPPDVRAFHPFGMADAEGFLAMGAVEIFLHTWDIATALDAPLQPDGAAEDLAAKLLTRLFPWSPAGVEPLPALLACAGRAEIEGFEPVGPRWMWHAAPISEWDGTIPREPESEQVPDAAPSSDHRPTWDAPPVTPDDLRAATRCFRETLDPATGRDWSLPAGTLEMSCWETMDHLAAALAYYVGQLATRTPVRRTPLRDRGGDCSAAELVQISETAALTLAVVAEATPPDARAYHVLGQADAEAFLAMACVELLVHAWDISQGFDLPMTPPAGVAPKLLSRLYRLAPTGYDAWETFLYCSGRIPLGNLPIQANGAWGWHVPPLTEWDGSPSPTWEGIP